MKNAIIPFTFVLLLGTLSSCTKKCHEINEQQQKLQQLEHAANNMSLPQQECINAINKLAYMYLKEEKNNKMAMHWFEKSAQLDNPYGMNGLGYMYEKYKHDNDTAMYWYEKAAKLGNILAMNNLGCLYQMHKHDDDSAMHWYKQASDRGHLYAKSNIGYLLEAEGRIDEAIEHYIAAKESPYAIVNLLHVYKSYPEKIDDELIQTYIKLFHKKQEQKEKDFIVYEEKFNDRWQNAMQTIAQFEL